MRVQLERIDQFVIDRLEGFTHWAQRIVGIEAVTWERICWIVAAVSFPKDYIWLFLCGLRFVLSFFCEHHCRGISNATVRTANPHKMETRGLRAVCFIVACGAIPAAIYYLNFGMQIYVLAVYFAVLDDLPRGQSRIKQWMRSFGKDRMAEVKAET